MGHIKCPDNRFCISTEYTSIQLTLLTNLVVLKTSSGNLKNLHQYVVRVSDGITTYKINNQLTHYEQQTYVGDCEIKEGIV